MRDGRLGVFRWESSGMMSIDRSIAGAEWVSAPIEMMSTPVLAMSRILFIVRPPETSINALPFMI
jgi:hypothetical protein